MSPIAPIDIDECDDIPEEFLCPISLCVMKDPVVSKNGQNYDRDAILQWLQSGNTTCPLTRQALSLGNLVPNHKLKMNILKWKMSKGILDNDDEHDEGKSNHRRSYDGSSAKGLMSMGLMMDFTEDMIHDMERHQRRQRRYQRRRERRAPETSIISPRPRQQTQQPAEDDLSDLLALYEEVLELTADSPANTATYIGSRTNMNETPEDVNAIVDEELKDIRELYQEVVDLNC
mmetsp:Transcript_21922/g.35275  ORF Transcript_21922/g.35275 Transcript_21922/m.35275 type:complete len:232 (+) Transcript_21922:130-825(+)